MKRNIAGIAVSPGAYVSGPEPGPDSGPTATFFRCGRPTTGSADLRRLAVIR
ncbi:MULTISPECIES: hypothetical protein [unclassified Streptomyces]|uniref:hypothetical protein n=1 Tax=unclassified Streptomyces TaxID=2593676 RepID=UPI0033D58247